MSYFNQCPDCGCNLDPGEVCECKLEKYIAEEKERNEEYGTLEKVV